MVNKAISAGKLEKRDRVFETIANILILLYAISIYIWSDDEGMVIYSTLLCFASMAFMLIAVLPRRHIVISRPMAYLILFDVYCSASILWAREPARAETIALRTLPLLTVFAIILYNYIVEIDGEKLLVDAIYIAGITLGIYTIVMQGGIGGYLQLLNSGVRVGDNVNNVNVIGLGTGISVIIAFYYIMFHRKVYHLVPLALCGFVALGTGSNKALVIMVLGCLLVLMFYAYVTNNVFTLLKALGVLFAFAVTFIALLQLPMFETINTRFEGMINAYLGVGRIDNSARIRDYLVQVGLRQFSKTPFFGIGINNGATVALQAVGHDYYLHNNYVELLVDCGVVGTFFFYGAIFSSLLKVIKGLKKGGPIFALVAIILLAWLIIQYGYVCYYSKTSYLYIVLAAAVAFPISSERKDATARYLES